MNILSISFAFLPFDQLLLFSCLFKVLVKWNCDLNYSAFHVVPNHYIWSVHLRCFLLLEDPLLGDHCRLILSIALFLFGYAVY